MGVMFWFDVLDFAYHRQAVEMLISEELKGQNECEGMIKTCLVAGTGVALREELGPLHVGFVHFFHLSLCLTLFTFSEVLRNSEKLSTLKAER